MSGPAAARARVSWMHARESVASLLGIELIEIEEGTAQVSMKLRADMTNGFKNVHGGIIFTLANSAFVYACNSRGGRAEAAQCLITFVEHGEVGDTLVATAREVFRIGRTGIYDVEVTSGSRTVAEFRAHARHLEQELV